MKRPEDALQRAVIELLGHAAVPGLFWFAVPNGGWRTPVEARIMKGLGVRAGVHDIILAIPPDGKMAGLELKAPRKGRISESQKRAHNDLITAGGVSALGVNSLDKACDILLSWGAIKVNRVRMM